MSTIRIDEKRWQKLTKKELELSVKMQKFVKKSQIVNYLIDNYLDDISIKNSEITSRNKAAAGG